MLELKISTYEAFNDKYPGFGGFLPWIAVDGGIITPTWDFHNRVPSLDNGEYFWALYGITGVLES
jgi:hypothetical protein